MSDIEKNLNESNLFPVQRTLLKTFYGVPLDRKETFEVVVWLPTGYQETRKYTEKSYLQYLFDEGRSNQKDSGSPRDNFLLISGRRSGKSHMGSECCKAHALSFPGTRSDYLSVYSHMRPRPWESLRPSDIERVMPWSSVLINGSSIYSGHTGMISLRGVANRGLLFIDQAKVRLENFPYNNEDLFSGDKTFMVSEASRKDSPLYQLYLTMKKSSRAFVARVPTWEMTPFCDFEQVLKAYSHPLIFFSEFAAQFMPAMNSEDVLAIEDIEEALRHLPFNEKLKAMSIILGKERI